MPAQILDQASLLRNLEKAIRPQKPETWMTPPDERFETR